MVKEDGSSTRGRLVVSEWVIQPEFIPPVQHLHHAHEESWYVLEGEVDFASGTSVKRVAPGDFVMVPIGIPHTFSNPGVVPARFLAIQTSNLYLEFFYELSERLETYGKRGRPSDEARAQIYAELMPRYQTEVVDPVAWERRHR